jgi:predicted MFS family arabinose efflux permease
VERGRADAVLPLRLLGSTRRWVPFAGMLLMAAMMIAFFTYSVILLQDQRGMDPLQAGLAYLPWSVSVVAGGWLVPRLVGRLGERVTAALGAVVAALGIVAFALLATDSPLWLGVLLPTLVIGFGPPFFFTLANNRIMADAPAKDAGAAAALLQSAQQLGGGVGVAVLTTVQVGLLGLGAERALTASLLVAVAFAVVLAGLVLGTRAFPGRPGVTPAPAPPAAPGVPAGPARRAGA